MDGEYLAYRRDVLWSYYGVRGYQAIDSTPENRYPKGKSRMFTCSHCFEKVGSSRLAPLEKYYPLCAGCHEQRMKKLREVR